MSTKDNPEKRALEALIVSRLRAGCGEQAEPDKLPSLSEREKASLKCLKPGFIQHLIESAAEHAEHAEEEECEEPIESSDVGNRELVHGMNRADDIDDVTEAELRKKRQEMQDKMREEQDGGRDCKGG
jgi:hypothetical protein